MTEKQSIREDEDGSEMFNLHTLPLYTSPEGVRFIQLPGLPDGTAIFIGQAPFINTSSLPEGCKLTTISQLTPPDPILTADEYQHLLASNAEFQLLPVKDGVEEVDRPLHVLFIDDVTPDTTLKKDEWVEIAAEEPLGITITLFVPLSEAPRFIETGLMPDKSIIFASRRDDPGYLAHQEMLVKAGIFRQSELKAKARSKLAFKHLLSEANIPTPQFFELGSLNEDTDISANLHALIAHSSEHTAYIKDPHANNGNGIIQISLTEDGRFSLRIPQNGEQKTDIPKLLVLAQESFSLQDLLKIYADNGYSFDIGQIKQFFVEEGIDRLRIGGQKIEIRVNMTPAAYTFRLRLLPDKDDYRANQIVGGTTIEGAAAINEYLATADNSVTLQRQIESAIAQLHTTFASNLPDLLRNGQSVDILLEKHDERLNAYVIETQGLEPSAGLLPQLAQEEMAARRRIIEES